VAKGFSGGTQTEVAVSKGSVTLDELLARRGLSVAKLAVLAEVDAATAYQIRAGATRPRATTIVRLADALGIGPVRMRAICRATWDQAHQETAA